MRYAGADILGGFTAMLITIPSSIAFGMIIYSPLGEGFAAQGALAGIVGAIALGLVAPLFGGTPSLVSSPCGPAAAVLAAFTAEVLKLHGTEPSQVPVLLALTTVIAGIIQLLTAGLKGGRLIKYIPYPVISGYLSGVGILLMTGQLPKVFGVHSFTGVFNPGMWCIEPLVIGVVTIAAMILAPRLTKKIPAAMVSFSAGIAAYWVTALFIPGLSSLSGNTFVVGYLGASMDGAFLSGIMGRWANPGIMDYEHLHVILFTAGTLAVLLSIDTLKTSVIVDALTNTRNDPDKELRGQGLGNIASGLFHGMAGAGTMGATLVNISSGGKTRLSGFYAGLFALTAFVALRPFVAWVPIPVLSGILIVSGYRIVDKNSLKLLLQRSTFFDFLVIMSVVISAVILNLIVASGVGVAFAILLFLREQTRVPIIAGKSYGNQVFSKRKRLPDEMKILYESGQNTVIYRLQGSLFFGTSEQLYSEIEPSIRTCRFMIMDLNRVISIDFTAIHRLEHAARQLADRGGILILTSLLENSGERQNKKRYLEDMGFAASNPHVLFFDELDEALEWTEEALISASGITRKEDAVLSIGELGLFANMETDVLATLSSYMKQMDFSHKEVIFMTGEDGDEIFFIRKGTVRILLPLERGRHHLLAVFGQGDFFGDMCFLENTSYPGLFTPHGKNRRSADAVADGDVSLYVLTREDFRRMAVSHPRPAGIFYEELAGALSMRLRQTTTELKSLQEA